MPEPFDMRLIQRGARLRRSPFFEATLRYGCRAYTVYNHMFLPSYYDDPVNEYWHLLNEVTLWDVAVERNTEITGPDAFRFTSLLTPRDLSKCSVGQGKYVLITTEDGGIVNDPVLLRLGEQHFWLAGADSEQAGERANDAPGGGNLGEQAGGGDAHRMDQRSGLRNLSAGWQPRRRVVGTHHGGGASVQYQGNGTERYPAHRRRDFEPWNGYDAK